MLRSALSGLSPGKHQRSELGFEMLVQGITPCIEVPTLQLESGQLDARHGDLYSTARFPLQLFSKE